MDVLKVLSELTMADGVTGNEFAAGDVAARLFGPYAEKVWRDNAGSVLARVGSGGPTLLVCAHLDEVGMMVEKIEENGMLRIRSVAGVDPRVLPGSRVCVCGREKLAAVVGAIPPHLLGEERKEAYRMDDLIVDTGLPKARVEALVAVGDFVTYEPLAQLPLKNELAAGKTWDDRALVSVMLEAAELLSTRKLSCTVVFCASVQEERTGFGAMAASVGVKPDIAVAMDVCHPFNKTELDRVSITTGGNIHPLLFARLKETAERIGVRYETDACIGATGTDAWSTQVQCGGLPSGLLSVPLKYMHTSVETGSVDTLRHCARLIAAFAASLNRENVDEVLTYFDKLDQQQEVKA